MRRADPHRIHELEYELGFRDDPPPPPHRPPPRTPGIENVAAIRSRPSGAYGLWQVRAGSGCPQHRPVKPAHSEALTRLYMDYVRTHGKE